MAGPGTLTATAAVVIYLVLSCLFLMWWHSGGEEAVAKLITGLFELVGSFISWRVIAISSTVDHVVDSLTGETINPLDPIDGKGSRALDKIRRLLGIVALSTTVGPDNVYHILVIKPGRYYDFSFGQMKTGVGTLIHIPNDTMGELTYKYGTTIRTIQGRYPSSTYVGLNLTNNPPNMIAVFLHVLISTPLARAFEKYYIHSYRLRHFGAFPPGNTKYG